jgi:hypothetical protein
VVEITEVNAREASVAAERLLADPWLRETLDELMAINTQNAIMQADAAKREEARQMVLAIGALRATLTNVFENWKEQGARRKRARSSE